MHWFVGTGTAVDAPEKTLRYALHLDYTVVVWNQTPFSLDIPPPCFTPSYDSAQHRVVSNMRGPDL